VLARLAQLKPGRVRGRDRPAAVNTALPAFRNYRFYVPTDCTDTIARRAASGSVSSLARIDNTIRGFSSAGTAGGLDMTIRLLSGEAHKKRALPQGLMRDIRDTARLQARVEAALTGHAPAAIDTGHRGN
jgi:hypothetical protein